MPVLFTTPLPSGQVPPVAAVVGEVMCTVNVELVWFVPAGTVTGPQVRTPAAIEQLPAQDVARELGMSLGAVYVAKSRVLKRIREEAEGLID